MFFAGYLLVDLHKNRFSAFFVLFLLICHFFLAGFLRRARYLFVTLDKNKFSIVFLDDYLDSSDRDRY